MILIELLAHPKVKRVSVGKCVDGSDWEDKFTDGHAHVDPNDKYLGWICVRSPRDIVCAKSNNLTRTMMHEFSHIETGHRHHDDVWRKSMHKNGQPIPKRYQKKRRRK